MQGRVAFVVSDVSAGPMLEQELKYVRFTVVAGGLQQGRASLVIQFVHIRLRKDQPLTDVKVLLHAGEGKRGLAPLVLLAGIRAEAQQKLDYLEVPIDTRFHQWCEGQRVFPVDIEKVPSVDLCPDQLSPLQKHTLSQLQVPTACRNVQSIAPILIRHCQVHILLEQ